MNIVDIAKEYFTVLPNSHNTYKLVEHDSVILFEDTNTYHRFSNGETGNIYKFLRNIVGLSHLEAVAMGFGDGEVSVGVQLANKLRASLRTEITSHTDYNIEEIYGRLGYNDYIASRMISKETSEQFELELQGPDVIIPLYNDNFHRIGSVKRFAFAQDKNDRYRTYMLGSNKKPCCWDFVSMQNLTPNMTVILVEGAWSVMRIHQVIKPLYPNILPIATLGTNVTPELMQYLDENDIIAILDDDTGGATVERSLQKYVRRGKMIKSVKIKESTKNVYVDDLSDKKLIKLFKAIL